MIRTKKGFLLLLLFAVFHSTFIEAQNDAALIKKANSEFQKGNYSSAINEYRQLLAKDPKSIDFNFKYATCLYHTDDINKATKYYDLILNMYEPPIESYFYRGKIYQNNYDFQKAIKCFEKYKSLLGKKDEDLGAAIEINHCKNALNEIKTPGTFKTIKKYYANRKDFYQTYSFTSVIYSFFKVENVFEKQNSKRNYIPIRASYTKIKYRLFASYGPNAEYGKDIFIQKKIGETDWSEPIRLGPEINSSGDEDFPFLDEEKGVLYFSSTGHNSIGGYDIFKVDFDLSTNTSSNRKNLNFPFSSPNDDLFFVPDPQTNNAYFASNRNGQLSKVEVYLIELSEKPVDLTFITGKLSDQIDSLNKSVQINVLNEASNERFGPFYSDEEGNYLISVPKSGTYKYQINVSGTTKEFIELVEIPKVSGNKKLNQEIVYSINDSKEKVEIITRILDEDKLLAKMELKKYKEMAKLEVNASTLKTEIKSLKENDLSDLGYSEVDSVMAFERLLDDLLDIQLDIEKNLKYEEELVTQLDNNHSQLEILKKDVIELNKKLNEVSDSQEKNKLEIDKRKLENQIQAISKQNYVLVKEIQAINENKLISREIFNEIKLVSEKLNEKILNESYTEAYKIISENKTLLNQVLVNRLEDKENLDKKKVYKIAEQKLNLESKITEQLQQIGNLKNQITSREAQLSKEKNKKEQDKIQNELKKLNKDLNLAKEINTQLQYELIKIKKEQEAYSENQEFLTKIDLKAEDKISFQSEKIASKNRIQPDEIMNEIIENEIRLSSTLEGKYEQDITEINRISNEIERKLKLKEREKEYQNELKNKLVSTNNESEREIITEQIQLSQSRLIELDEFLAQRSNSNGGLNENSNNGSGNSNSNEVVKNENSNQNGKVNENSNNGSGNSNNNEVAKNENSNQNGKVNENSNNGSNNSNNNEVAKNENSNQNGKLNENSNNDSNNSNNNVVAKNENSNQNGKVNENSNNGSNNSSNNEVAKNENSNQNGKVNENSNNGSNNSNNNEVAKNENSNQNGKLNENSNNGSNNSNNNEVAKNENSSQNGKENENSNNGSGNSNNNEVAKNENSNQNGKVNENSNNGSGNSSNNEVAKNENSNQNGKLNENSNNGSGNSNNNEVAKNENSNNDKNTFPSQDLKQSIQYSLNAETINKQIAFKKEQLSKTNSEENKKRIQNEISELMRESERNLKRGLEIQKRARFNQEFPGANIISNSDLIAEINEIKMKERSLENKISTIASEQEKKLLKEEKNQLTNLRKDLENKVNSSNEKSVLTDIMFTKSENLSDAEIELLRQNQNYINYIQERKKIIELSNELELANVENRNLREKINQSIYDSESSELSEQQIVLGNQLMENEQVSKTIQLQLRNQYELLNSIDKLHQYEWLLANEIKPAKFLATRDNSKILQTTFAIGQNTSVSFDKPLPLNVNSPSGLIYRVQVGAYRKPIPKEAFRDFSPVSGDILNNGLTCYMAGYFNSAQNAINARKQIRALGYTDAFIVAYCDGKRISFAKGRELELSGQCKAMTENELILALNKTLSNNEQIENSTQTSNSSSQDYLNGANVKKAEIGEDNQHLFFTVQVGVFNKPITENQLKQFDDLVTFKSDNGQIRYSSGLFKNVNDAKNHRIEVIGKGVPDAYVVAYYKGKRITIAEANNLIALNGSDILEKSSSTLNDEIANLSISNGNLVDLNIELPELNDQVELDSMIQFSLACDIKDAIPNLEKLNRIGIFSYQPEHDRIISPKMKRTEVTNIHKEYLKDFESKIETIDSTKMIELDVSNKISEGAFIDWLLRSDLNHRFESNDGIKKLNIYLDTDFQRDDFERKLDELKISILND